MKRIINPTTLRLLMAATAFVALAFSRQPRVLPAAAASAGGAETAAAPNYQGHFDAADCNTITGWAADTNRPNTPINVSIFDGPTLLTTVLANLPRPDVGSVLGDNGLHGFTIPFPPSLKDTHHHTLALRFESTNL